MDKALLLLITLLFISCNREEIKSKKEIKKEVKTQKLEKIKIKEVKDYNGTVLPVNEVRIETPTGGYVKEIYMKNGDKVDVGDIILTLTDIDVETAYLEAQGNLIKTESNYSKSKVTYEKYKKLFDKQYISEEIYLEGKTKYEEALGEVKIAKARFQRSKSNYDKLKVKAPISGDITDLSLKIGEKIAANTPLLTVLKNDIMEMKIAIDAVNIKRIKKGEKAEIFIPELNKKYVGEVNEINFSADSQTKKYDVKLLVDNPKGELIKGIYGKVKMEQKEVEGYFVPKQAVMIKDLYAYIAVEREGKAYIFKIDQGISVGNLQEIKTDKIEKNDRIIVQGQYLINNNDNVREI